MVYTGSILCIASVILGITGVLVGGSMIPAVAIMEYLFPLFSYAAIIGTLKVGSMARGAASTLSTRKEIHWKSVWFTSLPIFLGIAIGVSFLDELSRDWIVWIIVGAIIFSELARKVFVPYLSTLKQKSLFYICAFFLGIYSGLIGAGVGILLVTLYRLEHPEDSKIAVATIQGRAVEFITVSWSIVLHVLYGHVVWHWALIIAVGSFIGGYIGGYVLKNMVHISGNMQKVFLYIMYGVALGSIVLG